jgi:nitroreductase/NAD-dependent dihydropyrimidine dehydrogenase PreA subunit
MNFLDVDKTKCRHDGACVADCPVEILKLDEATQMPVVIEGRQEFCINCGHCVAVCPHGALSLGTMPVSVCEPLGNDWRLSPDAASRFLKGRRSTRVFKDKGVERPLIEKLIDTAHYAPSGINRQPVCWSVVYERKRVAEAAQLTVDWMKTLIKEQSPLAQGLHMESLLRAWEKGKDRICRRAPHLIVAYGLTDDMTAGQASTIALTFLELSAASFGLGACWAGYVHMAANMYPPLKKFLGLRSRENCYGIMLLGFAKYPYFRIPLRNTPKVIWR